MRQLLEDKRVASLLIVVGVVAAVLAIVIDPLRDYELYLGVVQIIVLVAGIVVALAGLYLAFVRKPAPPGR